MLCLKVACPLHNSTNFQMPWFALPQTKDSDTICQWIAEDASPRRHAEISPVNVKDTHLMNNKLPPAEIPCEEWHLLYIHYCHGWCYLNTYRQVSNIRRTLVGN